MATQTYEGGDGTKVIIGPHIAAMIEFIQDIYCNAVPLNGVALCSENAMDGGFADKRGIVAFVNKQGSYAHVLFDDGRLRNGTWHLFDNGNFSLS